VLESGNGRGCVAAPRKLGPAKEVLPQGKDVKLVRPLDMDDVEGTAHVDRALNRFGVGVESRMERFAKLSDAAAFKSATRSMSFV
jgi:hypothetical protein